MIIDEIKLSNFRSYQGEQSLSLSSNPEKHITIISGQNGFGKTSLLTALVWALYGKLMVDVDERYRKEINESGGYNKYAFRLMNRNALQTAPESENVLKQQHEQTQNVLHHKIIKEKIDKLYSLSVSIKLTNIFIPHLSCNDVVIKRVYNTRNQKDELEILIDGKTNELTKTIGQEIFINDFILPKEIAKFFFFDAEKITALAEVKNIEEKLYFSKAYNEVLGIKKYTDLKQNLENLHLRVTKKSASKGDLKKIEDLQIKAKECEEMLLLNKDQLVQNEQGLAIKKTDLADVHERLIRTGSAMTADELQEYKKIIANLNDAIAKNKSDFSELLELAPFAILAKKMDQVRKQLMLEELQQHYVLMNSLLNEKYHTLKNALAKFNDDSQEEIDSILKEVLFTEEERSTTVLLEFTPAQIHQFNSVYDLLQNAYAKKFKGLVSDAKRLQSTYNLTHKKVKDAELKSNDPVIQKLKIWFEGMNLEVNRLERERENLRVDIGILEKEIASIHRQLSEHTKHIRVEKQDQQKAETAVRLVEQLDAFIFQLKQRKKASLEKNIKKELNVLMHKQSFVNRVDVKIEGDLIDIDLYDNQGDVVNKDGLSKGEQQLYATALLKALVTESNIQFPVFIDSPLQKLDKKHSSNIIKEFYPTVSNQVVLFPLLEKELSEREYEMLLPKVGKAYLIKQQVGHSSTFVDLWPHDLFSQFNQSHQVYV